ncbi:hypothetical protein D3C78_1386690 [compost metagenome]
MIPPTHDERTAERGDTSTQGQCSFLGCQYVEVIAGQTGFRIDDALEQLLGEIHHRSAAWLGIRDRGRYVIRLRSVTNKCVAEQALLVHRREVETSRQCWGDIAVAAEDICQETEQQLAHTGQLADQREQRLPFFQRQGRTECVEGPLVEALDQFVVTLTQLHQPGIVVLH